MALDHAGGGLLLLINNQIMVLRHKRSPGT